MSRLSAALALALILAGCTSRQATPAEQAAAAAGAAESAEQAAQTSRKLEPTTSEEPTTTRPWPTTTRPWPTTTTAESWSVTAECSGFGGVNLTVNVGGETTVDGERIECEDPGRPPECERSFVSLEETVAATSAFYDGPSARTLDRLLAALDEEEAAHTPAFQAGCAGVTKPASAWSAYWDGLREDALLHWEAVR